MQRRRRWTWAVSVASMGLGLPSTALALDDAPAREAWTPALAAWGARAAPPGATSAPQLGVTASPTLVSVGQGATQAVVDASGDYPQPAVDETQRWVPGFAVQSGILGQKGEGRVDANSSITYEYVVRQNRNFIVTPPVLLVVTRSLREGKVNFFAPSNRPNRLVIGACLTCPPGIVLPVEGSNLFLSPVVGLSTELMTPGVQGLPGRPRLFFHGDASLAFSLARSFGREGVPDGAEFPPPQVSRIFSEVEVKGVGSITEAEVRPLVLSGGTGVAFTLDAWERRLRIKPSFEYLREEIDVRGRVTRAFRQDTGRRRVSATQPLIPNAFIPPISLESEDRLTSYGIGPGLEVEMDAARAGPFMLSLFVSGQAYRMLGNRDVELEDTQLVEVPDGNPTTPASQEVSAEWSFHPHAWSYRGGLGLRFRWAPED
jgi:hypothetical protein